MDSHQAILPDALRVNANPFQTDLCLYPDTMDVRFTSHPWHLGSGNPCRNDEPFHYLKHLANQVSFCTFFSTTGRVFLTLTLKKFWKKGALKLIIPLTFVGLSGIHLS